MKIYLDTCCFNRPFDDQSSLVIQMETEAKLYVQDLIRQGSLELIWSFMMDYENAANPFEAVRIQIAEWKALATANCTLSDEIASMAGALLELGLRPKDAAHVACAINMKATCFLTTDKKILNKPITGIEVMNPVDFVRGYFDA